MLTSNVNPSCKLALINDLILRMVLSTNPVSVCKLDVHRIRFGFSPLQNSLNFLLLEELPLSEQNSAKNFNTVSVSAFYKFVQMAIR